jgi:hypothetical protein
MNLSFTLKAVQSLQSFSRDIDDNVTLYGEILGVPVTISSPSAELLAKIDELLYGAAVPEETQTHHASEPHQNSSYADYTMSADYHVGDLDDD